MSTRFSSSTRLATTVLERLKGAALKEHWGGAFVKLAWTAGPVTYLALQGGYYIAYGKSAPPLIVLYFAAYTMVAGVFALLTRFLYNLTWGNAVEENREILESTFDALPQRIIEIRNLQLQSLDRDSQDVLAAKYLLENPNAGSDAIATAILDVTGDTSLSKEMTALEIYRSNGLYIKGNEKSRHLREKLSPHLERLNRISENVSQMILDRASEKGPHNTLGRKRTSGFLSRVFWASEGDNLDYMTLQDAEEVCILLFELINSRSFALFTTEYKGAKKYMEGADKLNRCRKDYRKHLYKRNNAIRLLAEELYQEKPRENRKKGSLPIPKIGVKKSRQGIQRLVASIPQIRSSKNLQERIIQAMTELMNTPSTPLGPQWKRLQNLYRNLYRSNLALKKSYDKFLHTWEAMQNIIKGKKQVNLIRTPKGKSGIYLKEKRIRLGDKRILPIARQVYEKLKEFDTKHENLNVNINDQKELAIDLLHIADQFLPLDKASVQRAIELTYSAFITRNSKNSRAPGQLSWNLSLVEGSRYPGQDYLHEILENLIKTEYLYLKDEDIDFLVDEYGGDRDKIKEITLKERNTKSSSFPLHRPEVIPPLEKLRT